MIHSIGSWVLFADWLVFVLFCFVLLVFKIRFLCVALAGYLGTRFVAQVGLELRDLSASSPACWDLKRVPPPPRQSSCFLTRVLFCD